MFVVRPCFIGFDAYFFKVFIGRLILSALVQSNLSNSKLKGPPKKKKSNYPKLRIMKVM